MTDEGLKKLSTMCDIIMNNYDWKLWCRILQDFMSSQHEKRPEFQFVKGWTAIGFTINLLTENT